ncbi:hypothetical protein MMC28_009460 [Mycoblastus sanguinarius]|nr:hypothetical protein [Mycoblastus sanguinarius]
MTSPSAQDPASAATQLQENMGRREHMALFVEFGDFSKANWYDDVCNALGYSNPFAAATRRDSDPAIRFPGYYGLESSTKGNGEGETKRGRVSGAHPPLDLQEDAETDCEDGGSGNEYVSNEGDCNNQAILYYGDEPDFSGIESIGDG